MNLLQSHDNNKIMKRYNITKQTNEILNSFALAWQRPAGRS